MAKARSIVKLSGTLGDVTFVDSKAYGFHSRGKRTVWEKSDGMIASSSNQTEANLMAKIIFDAVNELAPNFKDGKFWSRLVSVFRQQKKAGIAYNYEGFNHFDMRIDYPASAHGRFSVSTTNTADKPSPDVMLNYYLNKNMDYKLSILRIAADATLLNAYPSEVIEIAIAGEKTGEVSYGFSALPADTKALYVLKCEQSVNGKVTGLLKGQSVQFLKDTSIISATA
ncbi:hypothetical protein FA048_04110 [Pedobacter polaris]|uniref:Uncharacterized protein n=1 Tax=Pedobacter polaris TaxID=2571273 RepID=A0A4U1CYR4_9SPHI|nr:hypothetical protein [Pedobacter polaris]TKC12809.1 hypothetical protein FA048_04110 [Pedobacter polaris]